MNATEDRSPSASALDDDQVVRAVQEYLALVEAGQKPDRLAFANRYPDIARALAECLAGLDFVHAAAPELSGAGPGRALASLEAPDAPQSGTVGDFRIIREVGRGGMGIVYEAEQISLGRRVALKVLPFAATMDPRHLQRFQNEARAAASLEHPHIVPVHGIGCERGIHYYAMKFIDGQSLAALVEEQRAGDESEQSAPATNGKEKAAAETAAVAAARTERAPPDAAYFRRAAEWGVQAALALAHSHAVGVVHRDIKPANLMIDAQGKLWVTDFGLARAASDTALTMTGDLVGTLRYMSPEQALAGRGVLDHRTDIYSLGVTLYELLTLRPAFAASDRGRLLQQIEVEEPVPPRRINKSIPLELETIVHKAMEKNPADRYRTAQELADDLGRYLEDKPIRARRASLCRRLRGQCRRHKPLVIGLAVLVGTVLFLGASGLWWQFWSYERRRAATIEAVRNDLAEADLWQQQDHWPKALQALERASGRLQENRLDSLQDQVAQRRRQADLVARLNEAQVLASEAYADGTRDFSAADRAYAKAFSEHRLDVATLAAQDVADRIRSSAIGARLVAALDHWAYVKEHMPKGNGEPLRALARLADDDTWRKQLRNPPAARHLDTLQRLAEEEGVLKQPPVSLLLLCYLLDRLPGTPGPWSPGEEATREKAQTLMLRLLRQAQERYPDDFWLNLELGSRLSGQAESLAEAVGYLRAALAVNRRSPVVYNQLGIALEAQKKLPEAIAAYRKAIEYKPDNGCAYCNLGLGLQAQDKLPEAVAAYHEAIRIQPKFFLAHNNLAGALLAQGKLADAEAEYRKAIELGPTHPGAHYNLGAVLRAQGKLDDAVEAYRKAIELQPDFAQAYVNLGSVLHDQKKHIDAVEACRKAIAIQPKFAKAHYNLGNALFDLNKLPEAVEAYRKAIELQPDFALGHYNLGGALNRQGKLPEAEKAYRKAIELKQDYAEAYYNLGLTLEGRENLPEAEAAYRKVIDLRLRDHEAHNNLGVVLGKQQKLCEAEEACRKAIEFREDYAPAHCNLGLALREQGRFVESLASLKRAHELGSHTPDWRHPTAQWVLNGEQYVLLDTKLPKILKGEIQPADATERVALAKFCQLPCRQLYAASARFYNEAFAAEPALVADANTGNRYDAACAAALSGCAQGKDANNLKSEEYLRLRAQALAWLRADLDAWGARLEKEPNKARAQVLQKMLHWQRDADLNGVRGDPPRAKLAEAERQDWRKLWQDVEELRKRAAERKKTP